MAKASAEKDHDGFYEAGSFICQFGQGQSAEDDYCKSKVCFTATDVSFLRQLLLHLLKNPQCYYVKYSMHPKGGMHLGRAFYKTEEGAGKTWAHYKGHPKVMVNLQDDNIIGTYRPQVISWSDRLPDEFF